MRPGDVRVVLCCNVLCYVATFCATLQRRGCMAVCASVLLPKNWGPTRWGRRQAGGRRSGRSPEALWAQRACTFVWEMCSHVARLTLLRGGPLYAAGSWRRVVGAPSEQALREAVGALNAKKLAELHTKLRSMGLASA